ncbi:MAG: hypothetical protein NT105_11445 [Verrucomicrobia bacterium]|nr:hypothetical protein [Verrucomicrobiota bacterium]
MGKIVQAFNVRADLRWRSLLLIGIAALGGAIHVADGTLCPTALASLTLAIGCCLVGIFLLRTAHREAPGAGSELLTLRLILIVQFGMLLTSNPAAGFLRDGNGLPWMFVSGVGIAAMAGLLCTAAGSRTGATAFSLVLICHFVVGLWFLQHTNRPVIDTLMFQHHGVASLWEGSNPYAMRLPDPYSPENSAQFYGLGGSVNGRITFSFPYPPLCLFFAAPAYWLGDIRYAHLLAMTLAAALIGYARPGKWSYGVATVFLFTPRVFYVLGASWIEPFAVLLLAAVVFCMCRRPRIAPWVLGLLLAVKQYMVLALPLFALLLPARFRWSELGRLLSRSVLVALAVNLPFMLWDFAEFLNNIVLLQFSTPFRHDALSYLAWLFPNDVPPPVVSATVPLAAAFLAIIFALWRCPRGPSGFALAVGVVLLCFFAFGKQASANYYYFVIGALCCGLAAAGPAADGSGPVSSASKQAD